MTTKIFRPICERPPEKDKKKKGRTCPKCGSDDLNTIIYGMVDRKYLSKYSTGENKISLGGCVITDDSPAYECNKCGHKFGKTRQF